jgi:PAS domain S-box-containing protein
VSAALRIFETDIRKKIYSYMIALTILCGVVVLASSIWLFVRKLNAAMRDKVDTAATVVQHEIINLKSSARIAAVGMANDPEMIKAIVSKDRKKIATAAIALKTMTMLDYCVIMDSKGIVLVRTHDADNYNDDASILPHVKSALAGETNMHVMQGITVRLGASAAAPIYDRQRNIIGVVSLGYIFEKQGFVDELKAVTGCEVAIFLNDEPIASTFPNEDGSFASGAKVPENISRKVFAGDPHIGKMDLQGKATLVKYAPIFDAGDSVVGMLSIGYFTAEDTKSIWQFVLTGTLITISVLVACLVVARLVAGAVERRLKNMMDEVRQADEYTQLLLDAAPLCCILFDRNNNPIDCNHESVNTYKLKNKQEYISRFFDLMPKYQPSGQLSSDLAMANIKKASEDGHVVFNWQHQMLDGTPLPGEITLVRVNYKNDYVIAGFTRDLRAQVAAMAEVKEANERVLLMLDTSPLCTQIWSKNFNTLDCNEAAVKLYGFNDKQEYKDKFLECCSPEFQPDGRPSREKAIELVNKAFEEGKCIFEWMHKMPYADEQIPAEVTLVRAKYGGEDVIIGYTRDLRESKAAINAIDKLGKSIALSEYELLTYRLTAEAMEVGLWDTEVIDGKVFHPDNKYVWSQEFRQMLGFCDENDFPNALASLIDRMHPEDRDLMVSSMASHINDKSGKTPYDIEYRVMMKDGPYRWFRAFGNTLRDGNGVPLRVAGALMDIDERKRAQEEIQYRDKLLNAGNLASSQLLDVNAESFEEALLQSMRAIGEAVDVHHIGIWKNFLKDGRMHYYLLQNWSSEKRPPVTDSYVKEIPYDTFLVGLYEQMSCGEDFTNHVMNMRPEDQAQLRPQWIQSIFATPIFIKDEFWGFVGFDDCLRARDFTENEAMILRSTGRLIGNAFLSNETTADIKYRDSLLRAANNASVNLLDVSTDSFENNLARSMKAIAEAVDVHRVCIWKNCLVDGRWHCMMLQEWLSERRPPVSGYFPTNVSYDDVLPGWYETLSMGQVLTNHVGKMSAEEQEQLKPQRIQSLFVTPVFVSGIFWGYVGFDDCLKARDFTDNEAMILRSTGRLIGNAFFRNEMLLEMAEKNDLINIMFENAPVGLTLFNDNYKCIDCNDTVLEMFGVTKEFYSDFFGSDLHSPPLQPDGSDSLEKAMQIIGRVLDGETVKTEWMHRKPNGELLPVDLTMTRTKHGDKQIGLCYMYDMREQSRLKNEIEAALVEARQANRAKSEFLTHVSHEIRTPMNAVLGTAEIQLQKETHPPDTEEAFNTIVNSGSLLLSLINDILDISKIEAGRLEVISAKYDIPSLIYDTIQINLLRYENKPIEFILKIDENTPLYLSGDELRIRQVLNNLLSNAFKYTEKGTIQLAVSAEMGPETDDRFFLVLSISDTGQGLEKGQIDKLWDAYSRFNMDTNRNIAGTGLGLNITRQIVDLMNGEITVKSVFGKGSTFTVRLPQERIGPATCGPGLAENLRKNSLTNLSKAKRVRIIHEYMPYGSVLIVDDVGSNLYVAKGLMLPYGLKIETATCGSIAVEKIKAGKVYDIIFMDHMMPKMDGMEATKIIRSMGYTNSIVALTANAVAGQAELFLANGFDAFISKPIDSRELNSTLNSLVRDKHPPEAVLAARMQKGQKNTSHVGISTDNLEINPELAAAFADDVNNALNVLEEILPKINTPAGNKIKLFTTTVHGMKSALANLGERELSAMAYRLEEAGNREDMEAIAEEVQVFVNSLRVIVDKFKLEQQSGDRQYSQEDAAFLKEKVKKILYACDEIDIPAAKSAVADMKQKTWPPDISAGIDEITNHLLRGNLDQVELAAKNAINNFAAYVPEGGG